MIDQQVADLEKRLAAADWYITCLENILARKVVRGLSEAKAAYESTKEKK